MKKGLSNKVIKALYSFLILVSGMAVNTTCNSRYYQEKLSPQLDALRKHSDN